MNLSAPGQDGELLVPLVVAIADGPPTVVPGLFLSVGAGQATGVASIPAELFQDPAITEVTFTATLRGSRAEATVTIS